ncbi:MAG: LPS export ABC transporter permease LptF [Gammaproteobacteria bacterium]|nr:LPS export ABC transporter permease LptF [Gammaproteobacteria bacterium]
MIIDRYLTRQIAVSFAAVSSILVVIFLSYSLTRFLTDAASGVLRAEEVVTLTMLEVLVALEVLLPIALYFGLIVGVSNLHVNSEIIALQSCGISEQRMQRPIIVFTGALILFVAFVSTVARPWAYQKMYSMEANAEASSDIDRIKGGEFYLYDDDRRVVFVNSITDNGTVLHNIFVRTRRDDSLEIISAGSGRVETFVDASRHRLTLNNAHIYKQVEDGPNFAGTFGKLSFYIKAAVPEDISHKSKSKTTLALLQPATPEDSAELQWRLSTPISTLLLSLLALHMSRSKPREGRMTKLPLALGIYAVYFNLLGVSRNWVEQQLFPVIWWVPGLLVAVLIAWSWLELRARRR